jgi:preprotein translocase subunit Sec61beta
MPKPRKRKTANKEKDEGKREPESTFFTAAGLIAFSEEDAIVKFRPMHIMMLTIAFILAVIIFNII